jgi:uncharacterized membrane protein YeaQ/YmgE (transglycosylase-associated protein family)
MPKVNNFIWWIIDFLGSIGVFSMGFLAYLLVGGIVGAAASYYFPGFSRGIRTKSNPKRSKQVYVWSILLGTLGATLASYGGQMIGLFTSGQMLEWGSAVLGAFIATASYRALSN